MTFDEVKIAFGIIKEIEHIKSDISMVRASVKVRVYCDGGPGQTDLVLGINPGDVLNILVSKMDTEIMKLRVMGVQDEVFEYKLGLVPDPPGSACDIFEYKLGLVPDNDLSDCPDPPGSACDITA